MIINILYSTQFYTFLALNQYDRPLLTNIDLIDAIKTGERKSITLNHSIVLEYNINNDSFSDIIKDIRKNSDENVPVLEYGFDKMENDSSYVLIESKTAFQYLIKTYSQKAMLMNQDNMANDYLGIGFSKRSPIFLSFNRLYVSEYFDKII